MGHTSERDYMQALKHLTSASNLDKEQLYLAVNCAHLSYRSGLPFREMATTNYGPLRSAERNKPFSYIGSLDREKSFSLICKAAQLIMTFLRVLEIEEQENDDEGLGYDVFLGGSCNPTTWRKDTAIPVLEAGGWSYYNPQVDDWTPDLIAIEAKAKARADILLFVVDDQTRALASMLEVSEYIASGRRVMLCVKLIEAGAVLQGSIVSKAEADDLNRARQYLLEVANRHDVKIYSDVHEMLAGCGNELELAKQTKQKDLAHAKREKKKKPRQPTLHPETV